MNLQPLDKKAFPSGNRDISPCKRARTCLNGCGTATQSGYPSIIQGHDDTLHVVYSYYHRDRGDAPNGTIKYAQFNEAWLMAENQ